VTEVANAYLHHAVGLRAFQVKISAALRRLQSAERVAERGHLDDYMLRVPTHETFFANASTCFNVKRTAQGKILDTIHKLRQNVRSYQGLTN
jgi:hypothetical protein